MKSHFFSIGLAVTLFLGLAPLKAEQTPLILHVEPENQTVRSGDPVIWYITAAGAEPLEYQWERDG